MNQTEQAFQQAIAIWTSIMSHDFISFKRIDGVEEILHTNDKRKGQYDTYGYFHSESDNDDVLYSRYVEPISADERTREKIYYFVELLREDFEAKSTSLPEYEVVDDADFEYQRYLLVSRMNRLNVYTLLVSGQYNRFLTLTYL